METCSARSVLIRAAVERDIPRIIEMGHRFNRSSPYSTKLLASAEQMGVLARKLIPAKEILMLEVDGETVGMIGFYVYPHFLSGETIAGEIFWWVEPEYRGHGKELLRAAENEARNRGAKKMQMIAPDERVGKLYKRLKYEYVESTYQRSL
jgi:GNAT superfamily N-acetyltransferase